MLRLLVLSLIVLCCVRVSLATCGDCITSCNNGQCCKWDNPPIDTDPQSLIEPNRSPLGFTSAFFPRVNEADDVPFPCVSVDIPLNQLYYIQVAVESTVGVCVYEEGKEDEEGCGMALFFCNPDGYFGPNSVRFQFGCTVCQASESKFFFRVETEAVDRVDEYWCDNANTTLPSDLVQNVNTAFTPSDITPSATLPSHTTPPSDPIPTLNMTPLDVITGASPLHLVSPALLVMSMLYAALSL